MSNEIEQKATSILAGVRDNLLKPMAREIEQTQNDSCEALKQTIADLKSILETKIASLETKIAALEKFQRDTESERAVAMQQVKWDE